MASTRHDEKLTSSDTRTALSRGATRGNGPEAVPALLTNGGASPRRAIRPPTSEGTRAWQQLVRLVSGDARWTAGSDQLSGPEERRQAWAYLPAAHTRRIGAGPYRGAENLVLPPRGRKK